MQLGFFLISLFITVLLIKVIDRVWYESIYFLFFNSFVSIHHSWSTDDFKKEKKKIVSVSFSIY